MYSVLNETIINGVYINGIDMSGLSIEQAREKLSVIDEKVKKDINMFYDTYSYSISPEQISLKYDIEKAISSAYLIGRENNIFINNYKIIFSNFFHTNINIQNSYDNETLDYLISDVSAKIPNKFEDYNYYIEDTNLIITSPKEGLKVDEQALKNYIINNIDNMIDEKIEIPTKTHMPDAINIDNIYEEICTQPQNAEYIKEPFKIISHENGIDFDINSAKEMITQQQEEYVIPLIITEPEIKIADLDINVFPDKLSEFTTKYDVTNENRVNNLTLSSDKINEIIVAPGETFSYNKTVGERTIQTGYKEAAIYENGKVVQGIGGGICQTSTTLYNAVLEANLEIVERRNHQFKPSYVTAGLDATVAYGSIDFKFKNTRNYPIKIVSNVSSGIVRIEIYGIKEETEYDVKLVTNVIEITQYDTRYTTDYNLEPNQQYLVQAGSNGYKTETYKVLILDGIETSKQLLSTDTYKALERVIAKGN